MAKPFKDTAIETFDPHSIVAHAERCNEPSVFNGDVRVERYRVTIERIEEPAEVLRDRLKALLEQRGHIDRPKAIRAEAKRLGIDLS
jgi:hypothetical protein